MSVEKAIEIGEEQIDAAVGQIYNLPLTLNEGDPAQRGDIALLKKINRFIAIGTLVTSATIHAEGSELFEYGSWHLREAEAALKAITDGTFVLNSQTPIVAPNPDIVGGPIGSYRDPYSLVDDYYSSRAPGFAQRMSLPQYPRIERFGRA